MAIKSPPSILDNVHAIPHCRSAHCSGVVLATVRGGEMTEYLQILKACNTLREYGSIGGGELMEYWEGLADFYTKNSSMMSDELRATIAAEIKEQSKAIKFEYKIVTHTDTAQRSWREVMRIDD